MSIFLVDWGRNCNGARYALIEARSELDAFWKCDLIGSPFKIARLKIPKNRDLGIRYVEIESPAKPFIGPKISQCAKLRESASLMDEALTTQLK